MDPEFLILVSFGRAPFSTYILQLLRFSDLPNWSYSHVKVKFFIEMLLLSTSYVKPIQNL